MKGTTSTRLTFRVCASCDRLVAGPYGHRYDCQEGNES